jgi:O-antigen/teichoic acid export membrane protein
MNASLARSAFWLMGAKTVGFALAFALPLVLVRHLSQAEFGVYKQLFLLVSSAMTILPLGFVMSGFYFLPRHPTRRPRVAFNILFFYVAVGGLAALVLLWQPALLATLFHDPTLAALATPVAILVFLMVAFSFLELIALADADVQGASVLIVVMTLTKTVLLVGAAFVFASIEALVYATIVQGLLQAATLLWYLNTRFPGFRRGPDWPLMRAQLMYAMPLGTAAILSVVQGDLPSYFIAHYFDAATYAIYAVGCFQLPFLSILSESVGSVMIPAVSRLQLEDKASEIVQLSARLMRALAAIYFPLCVFLLVAGRDFLTVLFTVRYIDSWPIFAINLALIPLSILTSVSDPVLRAYPEYIPWLLRLRVIILGFLALGAWLAASHLLLIGAVVVVVTVNALDRVVLAVVLGRALKVSWRDLPLLGDVGKLAGAAGVAGLATAAARGLVGAGPLVVLATSAAVFAAVYLLSVLALGVLTPTERAAARDQVGRVLQRCGLRRSPPGLREIRGEEAP